jgi:hypothetical protein
LPTGRRRWLEIAALAAAVLVLLLVVATDAAAAPTTTTAAHADRAAGGLPFTGASSLSLMLASLVLVAVGAVSLRAGRYRHRH